MSGKSVSKHLQIRSIQSVFLSLVFGLMYSLWWVSAEVTYRSSINNSINDTDDLVKLRDICPGVEYLIKENQTITTVVNINNPSNCESCQPSDFASHQGVEYGMCANSSVYCHLHIEVPQGMFVQAQVKRLGFWCDSHQWRTTIYSGKYNSMTCNCHSLEKYWISSSSNHMYVHHLNLPLVTLDIKAIRYHGLLEIPLSPHSGNLIVPDLPRISGYIVKKIKAPPRYVIVISFPIRSDYENLELTYRESNTNQQCVERMGPRYDPPAKILSTQFLQFRYLLATFSDRYNNYAEILFSFHLNSYKPQKLSSELFNCSVDRYPYFQHHLDCNMKTECKDGQDETEHCPFSSPGCHGLVASTNKCFKYIKAHRVLCYQRAEHECRSKLGGRLASIKTQEEVNDFWQLFNHFKNIKVLIGCTVEWKNVPLFYKHICRWSDNTLMYNTDHIKIGGRSSHKVLATLIQMKIIFHAKRWLSSCLNELVCEIKPQPETVISIQRIKIPLSCPQLSTTLQTQQILSEYPDGHMTQSFLSCDCKSYYGRMTYSKVCAVFDMMSSAKNYIRNTLDFSTENTAHSVAMFECDDDIMTVPYTLVCDFREDCSDSSDESFCEHPSCNYYLCSNNQCVRHSQHCNGHSDCMDDSDESKCSANIDRILDHHVADRTQPVLIKLDGAGYFIQQVMKDNQSCPDTHYQCADDWLYCLPVYTRCNGFSDCTYGEDEQECKTMACRGLYKCRASSVCVHGDHLCDGWGQCLLRDDEYMCDMTCPEGCFCQGHTFVCRKYFSAGLYPQLRYLDATGSNMTLACFSINTYLIYLSLPRCSLADIPDMKLSNLQLINLANNQLRTVNMNGFLNLSNLKILILANNPLLSLTSKSFNVHYVLNKIDLSKTNLETLNGEMYLPQVRYLNVCFSDIKNIESPALKKIPHLTELDIRENPIKYFHFSLLLKLSHLESIFSSNFRFCCEHLLPKSADKIKCFSPHPMFSSCTTLLPTELFFWLVGIIAILANFICFVSLHVAKKIFHDNVIILLAHFYASNMCMGIHIIILAIANLLFYGQYIYFERSWTSSITCKVTGFLSLLSSEVSVLIISFMTLDHIIIICFPLSRWKFNNRSTTVSCTVSWFVGLLLSTTPYFTGLSQWGLDSQSGLCHPALFHRYYCDQKFRWFTVIVLLNFTLCFVDVINQVIIYKRTSKCILVTDRYKRSVYSWGNLLVKMTVTHAVCWISFGLTSVLALCGVVVTDKVHVFIVVFMLPLNSALSPLLYTWTVLTTRRQQAQEEKVLQAIKSRRSLSIK